TEAGTEPESEAVTEAETETETESEEGLDLNGYEDVHGIDMMGGQSEQIQTTGSEYIFPDVASRYLSRSEVEALSLQAICYAKNEIYARHGRKFVSRELQEYFGSKSWYDGFVEPESFADWVFNDYERANLDLIVSCELAIRSDGYQLDQPGYDIHAVNTASANTASGDSRQSDASSAGDVLNQDYIFPDSDSCYLTEEAVNALSKTEAGYAYKEILARRGCIFKTERYQSYFEGKSWYAGRISEDEFTSDMLNKFELYNLQLIKKLKAD
ncbi:MAG: YARHG domain-containing protein, partial [Lachnospiraceae bacterium]|nr:YARHG domain-containing protein [Lachnospiraceae bacterium]